MNQVSKIIFVTTVEISMSVEACAGWQLDYVAIVFVISDYVSLCSKFFPTLNGVCSLKDKLRQVWQHLSS